MDSETKNCGSCQKKFAIEPDDVAFYQQIKVPPPIWCPECRLLRRLNWLGCRILYKRKCDATGEDVITFYHPSLPLKVYRQDVWWGDSWDGKTYGRDYDFSKPFFEQYKELMDAVPKAALFTDYSSMVNSAYCNAATAQKNGYLVFKGVIGEDCAYTHFTLRAKNALDIAYSSDTELCYGSVNLRNCYQVFFSDDCEDSHDIWFSRDLVGCADCVGCVNMRKKSYCMFNEQLTKEEYQKRFKEFDFGSQNSVDRVRTKAQTLALEHPRRSFHGKNNVNVSGDYIYNSKNANSVYFVADSENIKYAQHFIKGGVQNSYDFTYFGSTSEWVYDSTWVGHNNNNVHFAVWNYRNHDTEYTFSCHSSENLFGCVGLRKDAYCILNKQYSKEEYFQLVEKIKKQMDELPYIDRVGRKHGYGGQIPVDLCPWAYNESTAYEFFPLTKEEAIAKGFSWRDEDKREYREATIVVPENINDAKDDMIKAILKCDDCGRNYQIIAMELQFLRRFHLPIPKQCPLCRDRARIKRLNPMTTYDRTCAKCNKVIKTSYTPDRPEIIYCEQCYQSEVV